MVLSVIFPVPSKLTPEAVTSPAKAIVRAVANAVASAESATAIFAEPSNDVPPIVLAVASVVAVVALPVKAPAKPTDVNNPVEGLYVRPVSVSIPCVPVAPSTKPKKTVSLVLLLAVTVTAVAKEAVPVRLAVTVPNCTLLDVPTA